jgi:hypothetical protein
MKLFARVIMCAACVLSLAPAVHAQTTATGAAGDPWSFSVGLNGAYEGNALFVGPDQEEEFSHSVAANLGRNWVLRRGSAQLGASASQYFYRETTSLNDFRYNVGGSFSHAITRRLTWSLGSNVSSGLARDAEVLIESGVVLPSVETRTSSSSSNLSYALSRRSQLGWSVSQTGVGFSSGLFQGGSTLGSVLSWTHGVGRSQSLGLSYDYSRAFIDDLDTTTVQGLSGTWSGIVGTWTAHASAGVRPYTVPEESGYRFSFGMNAGLTKPLRPGETIGVNYDRSVTSTFGLDAGNNLVQSLSGNYSRALTRSLGASVSGSYSLSSDPVTELESRGQTAAASLSYRVTPRLGVSVSTSFYSYTIPASERVSSYNMTTGLTYGFSWR